MQTLVVVDYGMGNLRSVARAFEFASREWDLPTAVAVSGDPDVVRSADKVVFPGQGAMPDCMRHLRESGLEDAVRRAAAEKPFFGVCVGMQMLFERSEEGDTTGLGIFAGAVRRFRPADASIKVPHMGWNEVEFNGSNVIAPRMFDGVPNRQRFYYVHSYFPDPADRNLVYAVSDYEKEFACALGRDNYFATQFHPEKSGRVGLRLLAAFSTWSGTC